MAFPIFFLSIHARHIDIKIDLWPTNIANKQIKNLALQYWQHQNIITRLTLDHIYLIFLHPIWWFFSLHYFGFKLLQVWLCSWDTNFPLVKYHSYWSLSLLSINILEKQNSWDFDLIKWKLTCSGHFFSIQTKNKSPAYIVDNCFLPKRQIRNKSMIHPLTVFPSSSFWGREGIKTKLRFKRFSVVEDILRPKSVTELFS